MSGQLCADDVVAWKSNQTSLAVVQRTYADVDTHDPYPGRAEEHQIISDPDIPKAVFRKFMTDGVPPKGTVLVRWQKHSKSPWLIPETKLVLVDRSLLIGDVVKKGVRDAMSGTVINTFTKCALQPMCEFKVPGDAQRSNSVHLRGLLPASGVSDNFNWAQRDINRPALVLDVPASELEYAESPTADDLVIYKDWIGRVHDCLTIIAVKLSDNGVVEIRDEDAEHLDHGEDAFCIGDLITTKKGYLRNGLWIYGKYNPNTLPVGTVVAVRNLSVGVGWLERRIGGSSDNMHEPPEELERTELESGQFHVYNRTKKPSKTSQDQDSSTISNSEIDIQLNLRVRFKDLSGACVKYDGTNGKSMLSRIDRKDTLGYDLNVFDVLGFQTDVEVQWQDLTVTRERSIDLIPETTIEDEHDAWPGEIVHPVELEINANDPDMQEATRVGVVQKVNAAERMAQVQWCPRSRVQYSVDPSVQDGMKSLVQRSVELASGETEEVSLYDVEAPGELNVRRGDLVLLLYPPENSSDGDRNINWLGEIVDTRLDGLLTVRLGAANVVRDVTVKRGECIVAIRSDDTDGMDWEAANAFGQSVRINSDGEIEVFDDDYGDDYSDYGSGDDGSDADTDSEEAEARYEDENGMPLDQADVEDEQWESESDTDAEMHDAPYTPQPEAPAADTSRVKDDTAAANTNERALTQGPDQYLMLSNAAPITHAYFSQIPSSMPGHMKRIAKEHRILSIASNLPPGVYVRTWESRLDLLRVLFLGPADTPYANAPFIIDFYLPPSFPTDPPQAFFHSWTVGNGLGGVGRVNPNLYEDGKICLSLLGTWTSGGKGATDSWNASRSTLLQVIVSLLGLVLVKEPYFNEAGYEPLAGLESSKRASDLYSERAFLKARTFTIAALEQRAGEGRVKGVEDLEDVLEWAYRSADGLRLLEKNIKEMEKMLERSDDNGSGEEKEVAGLSRGAQIALRRILDKLRETSAVQGV